MMGASGGLSGQESLAGVQYNGVVVAINFEGTEKRGEAKVRIESLHGDATETPDADLPTAIFDIKNSTDNFGTFNVGDKVTVEFPRGGRNTPVIVGKTMNLDSLKRVVPEYDQSYGQVRGMYSPNIDAAIFFNEATGSVQIRFVDGSNVEVKKGQVNVTSETLTVNINGNATVTAGGNIVANADGNVNVKAGGSATVKADGNATVEAGGTLTLKGAMIMEN